MRRTRHTDRQDTRNPDWPLYLRSPEWLHGRQAYHLTAPDHDLPGMPPFWLTPKEADHVRSTIREGLAQAWVEGRSSGWRDTPLTNNPYK